MRIATWNVNSLKARQEKVDWWLGRAAPDVLLLQETKLSDADAPVMAFAMAGYDLVHHGEGRWNGVAIAIRSGMTVSDIQTNFGDGPVRDTAAKAGAGAAGSAGSAGAASAQGDAEEDFDPLSEARIVSATVSAPVSATASAPGSAGTGALRVVSIYAPNGRVVDSPFYRGKLAWFDRLERWLATELAGGVSLIVGGDFNIAPSDDDVWDPGAVHGGTHVSAAEREAFDRLLALGLTDAYRSQRDERGRFTWWDYRAGSFHKNFGMRIDHLLATPDVAARIAWAEIDREARKGKPIPSDHAPVIVDLDGPGREIDAGWGAAGERIAARSGYRPG